MIDDERDQSISALLRMALETQSWAAAFKELLIAKQITTDEEFLRYLAAANSKEPQDGSDQVH
jgi:tripartite-type tricarboxylate transporter receptor subunit TctC